jgi:hypothetical protein
MSGSGESFPSTFRIWNFCASFPCGSFSWQLLPNFSGREFPKQACTSRNFARFRDMPPREFLSEISWLLKVCHFSSDMHLIFGLATCASLPDKLSARRCQKSWPDLILEVVPIDIGVSSRQSYLHTSSMVDSWCPISTFCRPSLAWNLFEKNVHCSQLAHYRNFTCVMWSHHTRKLSNNSTKSVAILQ